MRMKKLLVLLIAAAACAAAALPCFATEGKLTISSAPNKTSYSEGDPLDLTGLYLVYDDCATPTNAVQEIAYNATGVTSTPAQGSKLTAGISSVTLTYNGLHVSQPITVTSSSTGSNSGVAIGAVAVTNTDGTEAVKISRGSRFNFIARITDYEITKYGAFGTEDVIAKLNAPGFTFTGKADVKDFTVEEINGQKVVEYTLLFRDIIYDGPGNELKMEISCTDAARPLSSLSYTIGVCDTEEAKAPSLIVREIDYGGVGFIPGQVNTLSLGIYSTSGTDTLSDVIITLSLPDTVTLGAGSQTCYVGTMGANSLQTVTFQLTPKANATGTVSIGVSMEGTGADSKSKVSGSSTVAVPIVQPERFEITKLESSEVVNVGEEGFVNITFVNKGKTTISNLSASVSGDNFADQGQSQYLGNVAPGTESSVDFDISPLEAGAVSGVITLSYEDDSGNQKTMTKEFSLTAEETVMEMPEEWQDEPIEEEPTGLGLPAKAGIAAVIVAIAAAIVVVIRRKRHAGKGAGTSDEDF